LIFFVSFFQEDIANILHGDVEWHYMKFKVPYLTFLYSSGLVQFRNGGNHLSPSGPNSLPQTSNAILSVCDCQDLRREYILNYL
jgi:hypothetical protein